MNEYRKYAEKFGIEAARAKWREYAKQSYYRNKARLSPGYLRHRESNAEAVNRHYALHPEKLATKRARDKANLVSAYHALPSEQRVLTNAQRWQARIARLKSEGRYEDFLAAQRARHQAWRDANSEHIRSYRRAHAQPYDIRRTYTVARQNRLRGGGPFDVDYCVWLRSQPCLDCGATEHIHVSHLIPVSRGGTNGKQNLVALCRRCNLRLSNKIHPQAMFLHYPQQVRVAA